MYLFNLYHLIVQWLESWDAFVDLLLADYRKVLDLIKHLVAGTNLKRMGVSKPTAYLTYILLLVTDLLRSRYERVYLLFSGNLNSEWESNCMWSI